MSECSAFPDARWYGQLWYGQHGFFVVNMSYNIEAVPRNTLILDRPESLEFLKRLFSLTGHHTKRELRYIERHHPGCFREEYIDRGLVSERKKRRFLKKHDPVLYHQLYIAKSGWMMCHATDTAVVQRDKPRSHICDIDCFPPTSNGERPLVMEDELDVSLNKSLAAEIARGECIDLRTN